MSECHSLNFLRDSEFPDPQSHDNGFETELESPDDSSLAESDSAEHQYQEEEPLGRESESLDYHQYQDNPYLADSQYPEDLVGIEPQSPYPHILDDSPWEESESLDSQYQEDPLEIESESPDYYGSDTSNWIESDSAEYQYQDRGDTLPEDGEEVFPGKHSEISFSGGLGACEMKCLSTGCSSEGPSSAYPGPLSHSVGSASGG